MTIDASHPEMQAVFGMLEARIEEARQRQNIPGLSTGVLIDQQVMWSRGFGFSDLATKHPASPETIYRIGSITKLFTATMLMMLRDAGKLQLDDPVEKYLPAFKVRSSFADACPPTFRELATHLSGMPREFPGDYWREQKFPAITEILARIGEIEMILPQMTELKYSNLAFAILGHALETIAGQSYESFIQERILDPLDMAHTGFHEGANNICERLSVGYKVEKGSDPVVESYPDIAAFTPAGQMYASIEDILKFAAFHFCEDPEYDGPRLLSPRSLREMHAPVFMAPDWQSGRAIGFGLSRVANHTAIAHTGGINGFVTDLRMIPDLKVAIATFTNCGSDPISISRMALEEVLPVVERAKARSAQAAAPVLPEWERFCGVYEEGEVKVVGGRLVVHTPDSAPAATDIVLTPAGENRFKMKGGAVSGELLTFDVDAEGRVRGLWVGNYYTERKS